MQINMLQSLNFTQKMPSLVCQRCLEFTFPRYFLGTLHSGHYSTKVKDDVAKNRPKTSSPWHQGSRRPPSRHADPIRPISDMLLRTLVKRHEFSADVPAKTSGSVTSACLSALSTEDLIRTIYASPKNAMKKAEHLQNIDQLLIKRLYQMPLALMLQACHGFYVREHNFNHFMSQIFTVVDETFDSLSPSASEVTQLFLYIFIHGAAPNMLFHKVEEYLLKNLDKFHINDLGVVCVGIFRGNTRVSSYDLIDAVADRLLRDMGSLEPFLLMNFLKMFRQASYISISFYQKLADHLVQSNFMSNYRSINPIMHIAFTYASISIRHTQLFETLFSCAEKLLAHQRTVRTKDVSKFVWACGTLQFKPDNHEQRYGQLVRYFEKISGNGSDYPESCAELLMGLAYLGIFPEGLLHKCLSSDMASKLLDRGAGKEKTIQLLLLHETVQIECPNYTGNVLSEGQLTAMTQHPSVSRDLPRELQTRVGLLAVLSALQQSLGVDKVHCLFPLPHFKTAVIELRHCGEDGFLSFTPGPPQQQSSLPKSVNTFTQRAITDSVYSALTASNQKRETQKTGSPQTREFERLAVLVSCSSQYALNDKTHMLGQVHTLKRQLQSTGYKVIEIVPEDALCLELKSHEERCQYLSTLVSSALQISLTL